MRRLISILIISAITLILFELTLRIFNPWDVRYFLELAQLDKLYQLSDTREMLRELRPNATVVVKGIEYSINEQHVRDLPLTNNESEKRIIFLGDSIVFGVGVPLEKTFPKLIQFSLNAINHGNKFHAIPAGIIGYNTLEEYSFLKEMEISLGPIWFFLSTWIMIMLTTEHGESTLKY